MQLNPAGLTKLSNLWDWHKRKCDHKGDAKLEQMNDGGIGTVTKLTCGCGEVFDVTDYFSW